MPVAIGGAAEAAPSASSGTAFFAATVANTATDRELSLFIRQTIAHIEDKTLHPWLRSSFQRIGRGARGTFLYPDEFGAQADAV
ncbi:MAG: hypothetical protein KF742_01725 [Cryobacterium sp.]|nr:hypothetical protein [Cryobacterium sp.]